MGFVSQVVGRLRVLGLRRAALLVVGGLSVWWAGGKLLPDRVDATPVTRRLLVQSIVATGRVRSLSRARLGPAVSGTVARVLVRDGERVSAGQLLVQLDPAEALAQLAQARAALGQAEAGMAGMVELRTSVAAATLRSAEVRFQRAQSEYQRTQRLVEAGATAADQLDLANQTLEAARAERDIAEVQLRAAQGGGADRRTAEAARAQASASVQAAQARLDNTRIVAPGPGRVLTRDVEPGDVVQTGRVLLTLALDGPTQISAVPDEKDVARLREGQPAVASADAYPGERFAAKVSYLASSIDPAQGTVEVRLDVDSAPEYLLPDMTVSVQIETGRRPTALLVPVTAVVGLLGTTPSVWAVRDGRSVLAPVTIGVRGEEYLEILEGLAEGDLVITVPPNGITSGQRVRARRVGEAGG
ncbi:MAG: efflux RND transporter periplasmic adaptor subunit [Gemmatimonadales bacterium]